jgi:hypothetical protein
MLRRRKAKHHSRSTILYKKLHYVLVSNFYHLVKELNTILAFKMISCLSRENNLRGCFPIMLDLKKQLKLFIAVFMLNSLLYGNDSLKTLDFTKFDAEEVFNKIDTYTKEAPEQVKKLKDEDKKVRDAGIKFFMDMPAIPSEVIVQALLNERDTSIRSHLKKIIMSGIDKPTFEDWTQSVLVGLTKHIIDNNGKTKHLLEIAHRNKSSKLIPSLEAAMSKRAGQEDLLKVYKKSKDKIKLILFKAVSDSLNKEEIDKALSSPLVPLKFKAAKHQISKENNKAFKVILNLLTSEKEIAQECSDLLSKIDNIGFDTEIKNLINELGADSAENREKAQETLTALPSSTSKKIEVLGIKIFKETDNTELRISFLNIIQKRINDLMKKPGYIGVQLVEKVEDGNTKVVITSIFNNTPASKAEITANSEIMKVNEISFENSGLSTFREHLKTLSAGTTINLSLKNSAGEVLIKKVTLADKPNITDTYILNQWKIKHLGNQTNLK